MWRAALRGLVDLVAPRRCPGCDDELEWGALGFCEACAPLLERLSSGPALYGYGGPLAVGIRELKYRRRLDYIDPLAALLVEGAAKHLGRVDVVVPIPLHPSKMAERGFNQSELLALALARALEVDLAPTRLVRVRRGVSQASLRGEVRRQNLRGAFRARTGAARVLLVDDVRTTGATLLAASAALREAGATDVRVLALAATEP